MMIDSYKLLSRGSRDKSVLSEKTITNITIIKKDVKKIDSLLKEKLVLSKVRQGILNRQAEQLRRRKREDDLEKDVEDDNPRITFSQEPQKQKRGGLFTTLFVGLIGGIGFLVMKSLPIFKTIGRALRAIASPFIKLFTVLGRLVGALVDKVKGGSDNLKDVSKKNKKDLDQLPSRIDRIGNDLLTLAGVMLANSIISSIFAGVGARKVSKVVNAARSQRLMTPVQVSAVKKAMKESAVAQTVQGPATTLERLTAGRKITKNYTKNLIREVAGSVEKESMTTVEEAVENVSRGRVGKKINKQLELFGQNVGGRAIATEFGDIMGDVGIPGYRGAKFKGRKRMGDPNAIDPKILNEIFRKSPKGIVSKSTQISDEILKNFKITDVGLGIDFGMMTNAQKREAVFIVAQNNFFKEFGREPKNLDELFDFVKSTKFTNFGFERIGGQTFNQTIAPFGVRGGQIGPKTAADFRFSQTIGKGSATGADPFTGAPTFKVNPRGRTIDPNTGSFFAKKSRTAKIGADALLDASKTVAGRTTLKSLGFVSKNVIRQSLGAVPLLGDLAVLLLDIYVFGEIPARAGFKTIGSIIGSIIGGILGSLVGPVGTIVGSVVGGIGGDILGAVTYDFFENRANLGTYSRETPRKISKSDINRAGLSGSVKGVTVKDLGGDFMKNQIAVNKGGNEYIFDSNTTEAFKQFAPGALEAANRESGKAAIEALTAKLPKKNGKTKTVLLPIMMPSKNNEEQQTLMVNKRNVDNDFLSIVTQSRYMRA